MKHRLITSFLLAVFLLSPLPLVGASPLTIKPTDPKTHKESYYITDRKVMLTVTVDRKPEDRLLYIVLDCVGYFSESRIEIIDKDPKNFRATFVNVLPGDCQGIAILHREEKGKMKEYVAVTPVIQFFASGPSPEA
jgi:hypothetical protein